MCEFFLQPCIQLHEILNLSNLVFLFTKVTFRMYDNDSYDFKDCCNNIKNYKQKA